MKKFSRLRTTWELKDMKRDLQKVEKLTDKLDRVDMTNEEAIEILDVVVDKSEESFDTAVKLLKKLNRFIEEIE